jgi:hypothetical protein
MLANQAAERAAAPAEVTEARKLQDSAQHAAKRAAAPAEVTEARKLQKSFTSSTRATPTIEAITGLQLSLKLSLCRRQMPFRLYR